MTGRRIEIEVHRFDGVKLGTVTIDEETQFVHGTIVTMTSGRGPRGDDRPPNEVPASVTVVGLTEEQFYGLGSRNVILLPFRLDHVDPEAPEAQA